VYTNNRWNYVEANPANRTDPSGHTDQDPGDSSAWWDEYTPVYILQNVEDDVLQHKALVDYMFEHPGYNSGTDAEITAACWDLGTTIALLSTYQFLAGARRLEMRQMNIGEFWATYGAPMVAAAIVFEGGPAQSPMWNRFKPYQGKIRTNGLPGSDREYYRWDYTHSDIEVYNNNGYYQGSIDPVTGEMYRPASRSQRGRNIFK
jgi:hypothetical protein